MVEMVEMKELQEENKRLKEELLEKEQTLRACEEEYRRVVNKLNELVVKRE